MTRTHPLLAPRPALEGMVRYVYTAQDFDEIIDAIWAPAGDKGAAFRLIMSATGTGRVAFDRSRIADAITRHEAVIGAVARARPASLIPAKTSPRKTPRPTTGAWCRRCHGPSADGSGLCHEC